MSSSNILWSGAAAMSLMLASVAPTPCYGQAASLSVPYGPHTVGYREMVLYDRGRNIPSQSATGEPERLPHPRPIHVSVWYPSERRASAKAMRYGDYLDLFSLPLALPKRGVNARGASDSSLLSYENLLIRNRGVSVAARRDSLRAAIARERDVPVRAARNAPPLTGSYPILVYAAGAAGPSFENEMLLEYLASRGYLVYGVPCWPGTAFGGTEGATAFESVARDMEFVLGHARSASGKGTTPAALMGWSCGGLASVTVANRNASVNAIVGLDATVRYTWSNLTTRAKFAPGGPYTTPALFLNQGNTPASTIARAGGDTVFTYFDSLRYADAYVVTLRNMRHQNFASMYNRLAGAQPDFFVSEPRTAAKAYTTMAVYTATFLDAYLKDDRAARERLTWSPSRLGVPDSNVTVTRKQALRPLPTIAAFRATIGARGLASAPQVFEEIRRRDPGYKLSEALLSNWGWSLDGNEQIGVFRVRVAQEPGNTGALLDLGSAYLSTKDTTAAITAFERALQTDSTSSYARSQLQKLRGR